MEAEELQTGAAHHGHNIRRTRRMKGIKQMALADTLEMSQQTISRYESMPEIEEAMLQKFAKALNVPVESLKMAAEEASMVVFENNSVTNNNESGANSATNTNELNDYHTGTFNPIEKIIELYERLLEEEKAKFAALEQRLLAVEKKLDK